MDADSLRTCISLEPAIRNQLITKSRSDVETITSEICVFTVKSVVDSMLSDC